MKHENPTIIDRLREKGFRITNARKGIIRSLSQQHCALSAQDVHQLLKEQGISANLSTIYRELQFLSEQNIAQEIALKDGIQRFELIDQSHHHHLICTHCDAVEPIEMEHDLDQLEVTIHQKRGFKVNNHSLEFYGACASCH